MIKLNSFNLILYLIRMNIIILVVYIFFELTIYKGINLPELKKLVILSAATPELNG